MSALIARLVYFFRQRAGRGRPVDPRAGAVIGPAPSSGIEVTTAFDPPWFARRWNIRPSLEIDGADAIRWQWGTSVLPIVPGNHGLRCWTPMRWLFMAFELHAANVEVAVPEGGLVRLRYTAGPGAFRRGQWEQGTTVGYPSGGPGQPPDPLARVPHSGWS